MAASWAPGADIALLKERAAAVDRVREYFRRSGAWEVHTPVLMRHGNPDPAISSLQVPVPGATRRGFLQTSPEFAMKRLLAAGAGDIYQFAPAFRGDESGRHHLAEFTLLEWYRLGHDHHALMDDVAALVQLLLPRLRFRRLSAAALFDAVHNCDPHSASTAALAGIAARSGIELGASAADRATVLDALYAAACHAPGQTQTEGLFVYDFPVEHAAYARIAPGSPAVAERFELVVDGMELANGYHEVVDASEQRRRFAAENARRRELGMKTVQPDEALLAALEHGMPPCAGVALGFDRLMMVKTGVRHISQVVAFAPFQDDA